MGGPGRLDNHHLSEHYNIIGNDLVGSTKDGDKSGEKKARILESGKNFYFGPTTKDARIPASLLYERKPDYVKQWPLYGPPLVPDSVDE